MTARGRWALGCTAVVVVLAGASGAHAALTTPSCLAKKLNEWGNLRKCQAVENGKKLQAKAFDLAKCQTKFDEKLTKLDEKATAAAIRCRYGDNGDGTVTDYDTGLQWEQKTDDLSVHDKDNLYQWSITGFPPDGGAFTDFLADRSMNYCVLGYPMYQGFAGHCDWRLPSASELQGIVDRPRGACGGGSGACIDPIFGPTIAGEYWSTTHGDPNDSGAVVVDFANGWINFTFKGVALSVRAVRAAL